MALDEEDEISINDIGKYIDFIVPFFYLHSQSKCIRLSLLYVLSASSKYVSENDLWGSMPTNYIVWFPSIFEGIAGSKNLSHNKSSISAVDLYKSSFRQILS